MHGLSFEELEEVVDVVQPEVDGGEDRVKRVKEDVGRDYKEYLYGLQLLPTQDRDVLRGRTEVVDQRDKVPNVDPLVLPPLTQSTPGQPPTPGPDWSFSGASRGTLHRRVNTCGGSRE